MEEVGYAVRNKRRRSLSAESVHNNEEVHSDSPQPIDYFPASKLFEYQWPLGKEGAEFYILQEQVKEFLNIRGIQRKYPDLYRRGVELDERKYLMGRGVVTETQSNMGLVALRSEDVLELMVEDYPEKYEEYQVVLQEREFQATIRKNVMQTKRFALMVETQKKSAISEVTSAAVRGVVSYNSQLAEVRRSLRKEYLDTQTNLVHVPRRPPVVCPTPSNLSRYPVALLPGQYCDSVRKYTPEELHQLPLTTVTKLPLETEENSEPVADPVVFDQTASADSLSKSILNSLLSITPISSAGPSSASNSASNPHFPLQKYNFTLSKSILSAILSKSQFSSASGTSLSSPVPKPLTVQSGMELGWDGKGSKVRDPEIVAAFGPVKLVGVEGDGAGGGRTSTTAITVGEALLSGVSRPPITASLLPPVSGTMVTPAPGPSSVPEMKSKLPVKSSQCRVCFKGRSCNKLGNPEEFITCSNCRASIHPSCYDLNLKVLTILRSYKWQCLDCKSCHLCSDPDQDDKMMCCEECDRGYHSFCVGLEEIPKGRWVCRLCSECASCGCGSSGKAPEGSTDEVKWKHEYYKARFIQTLCQECSSYFRRGYFCPVCLRVYHDDETDSPMVCCDQCDRWIHTECDGISDSKYKELSTEDKSVYICCLCRGEVKERVDKYHKKHRSVL